MADVHACIIEELMLFIPNSINLLYFMETFCDHIIFNQIFVLNVVVVILIDIANKGLHASLIDDISLWLKFWTKKQSTINFHLCSTTY